MKAQEHTPLLRSWSKRQESMEISEKLDFEDISSEISSAENPKGAFSIAKFSFLRIDYALYFTLIFKALLPAIYSTVRVSLLGNLPTDNGINIASQVVWLSLCFEVLQEMLILPLY